MYTLVAAINGLFRLYACSSAIDYVHGQLQHQNKSTGSVDSGMSESMQEDGEHKHSDVSPIKENGHQEDGVDVKEKDNTVKELVERVDQLEKRLESLETSSRSSTPEMSKKVNADSSTSERRKSDVYPCTQSWSGGQFTKATIERTSSDASPKHCLVKTRSKLGFHVPKALSAGDAVSY